MTESETLQAPYPAPGDQPGFNGYVVGIGASAGGLDALEQFFLNMPPQPGMAFVVIQHLSPDYKSLMVELISKYTPMRVYAARHLMAVENNTVYVIPPNRDLSISAGRLELKEQTRGQGINLPIDLFLRSLAEERGDRSVAVILSGTGSDGSRGVRAIKEQLGLVMAQEPGSAAFDGMPKNAISTGLVDYVLEPAAMPAQLVSLASQQGLPLTPISAPAETRSHLAEVFAQLRQATRVDFSHYKSSTILRRLQRRMTMAHSGDIPAYVDLLKRDPTEVERLFRDLLIGVTSFFRDPAAFEILGEQYLPELLMRGNDDLRFWVPGCSSGEEAFSLAIMTEEVQQKLDVRRKYRIFATDLDRAALGRAGNGVFNESIAADLDRRILSKYFTKVEGGFRVSRAIREKVVFAQHNVLVDPPFTNISLLSCRNLLIYLEPVLQHQVLEFFAFSLNPGGILFLGASETVGGSVDYFDTLSMKWRLFRATPRTGHVNISSSLLSQPALSSRMSSPPLQPLPVHEEERILDRLLESLVHREIPCCMVVDESGALLYLSGHTERYLRFPSGRLSSTLSRLLHDDLRLPVMSNLQKVFEEGIERKLSSVITDTLGRRQKVEISIRSLPGKASQPRLVAVLIDDRVPGDSLAADVTDYDVSEESRERISGLEEELQFTRENLQAAIEELETSNEELQATNEELLSSNEELHSTNEELQSVNQELYTVNTEYQLKIVELTEATNDLDNLFEDIRIAIVFLDENRDIRRFTPEAARLFRIGQRDIGHSFSYVSHGLNEADLEHLIDRVQARGEVAEHYFTGQDGRTHLVRIVPYRVATDRFAGLVISALDVTLVRQLNQAVDNQRSIQTLAYEEKGLGSWSLDIDSMHIDWSPAAERLLQFDRGALPGRFDDFIQHIPQSHRAEVNSALNDAIRHGRPFHLEHPITNGLGQQTFVRQSGVAHRDTDGRARTLFSLIEETSGDEITIGDTPVSGEPDTSRQDEPGNRA
jgi:two-component system, chemotaxis family, CheB/CheR fusion protein